MIQKSLNSGLKSKSKAVTTLSEIGDVSFSVLMPFANSIARWAEMSGELFAPYGIAKGAAYKIGSKFTSKESKISAEERLLNDEAKESGFGYEEYRIIDTHCKEKKIEWFASAWDLESLEFLKTFNLSEDQYNIEKTIVPEILYSFKKRPETIIANTYSMFYHNKRCFDLIEKYYQKFDIIIRFRADIHSPEVLPILNIKPNTIYIPKGQDPFEGTINDQVAYGDFNSIKIYCEVVNNIIAFCNCNKPQLIKSFNSIINKNTLFHPETLMKKQLDVCRLNIIRFDYTYNLDKIRFN
jgi:hypothetical protein